ncbi:MAG: BatA domain-containing protein [Planctomycetota bacterium]
MMFAAPGFAILVGAILVPLLVLLYFLKLKRREQAVPASFLWSTAIRDMQANASSSDCG